MCFVFVFVFVFVSNRCSDNTFNWVSGNWLGGGQRCLGVALRCRRQSTGQRGLEAGRSLGNCQFTGKTGRVHLCEKLKGPCIEVRKNYILSKNTEQHSSGLQQNIILAKIKTELKLYQLRDDKLQHLKTNSHDPCNYSLLSLYFIGFLSAFVYFFIPIFWYNFAHSFAEASKYPAIGWLFYYCFLKISFLSFYEIILFILLITSFWSKFTLFLSILFQISYILLTFTYF